MRLPYKQNYAKIAVAIFLFWLTSLAFFVYAEDSSSTNFILRDSVIDLEGGYSTSTNFQYFSGAGQLNTAEATSTAFIHRGGVFYFPTATSPVLSATAGNAQASLSWTVSAGTLANITNYQVGVATASGGPYTFESAGNVLTFTKTGLTNGTKYYFVIKAYAGTLALAQSGEASATPSAPAASAPTGGGGGGGGGNPPVSTAVNFSGRAFPLSKVIVLKDGQIAVSTIAGPDARFYIDMAGLSAGNYVFALYGEDSKGLRSNLFTFPVYITYGGTTNVGGIFIAPTIAVDKSEVKRGDNIAIFGQSVPNDEVIISVNSDQEFFDKINADANGAYLYNFDTSPLETGRHFTKSKTALNSEISSFSATIGFAVGTKNVAAVPSKTMLKGDLNNDGRVNLVDFSIAAYWYKRPLSAAFKIVEKERLNGDGKIDLVDFSIMAYYWTG